MKDGKTHAVPLRPALLILLFGYLTAGPSGAQGQPAATQMAPEPPPAGYSLEDLGLTPPGSKARDDDDDNPESVCFVLAKEGRALLKQKRIPEGLAKLREAVALGERIKLKDEDLAALLDAYGLAQHKGDDDPGAVISLRRAADLAKKDATLKLDLAQALFRVQAYDEARRAAEQALSLGLTGEDADDARDTLKEAKRESLHQKIQSDASASFGYDTNIQQSAQTQTIANKSTRSAGRSQVLKRSALGKSNLNMGLQNFEATYQKYIRDNYALPSPQTSQWGLPLNLGLDLSGRPLGDGKLGLWIGYRFSQLIITDAETDTTGVLPDKDTYDFQEHTLMLWLAAKPTPWLDLKVRAEGFANFSGLVGFAPFQYGFNGILDATFIESKMWRTRLYYSHNFRRSFDQGTPGATDPAAQGDAYLNGNRDQIKLTQELRKKWVRPQLGYQFTNDSTGVLFTSLPFGIGALMPPPGVSIDTGCPASGVRNCIGTLTYYAPLSYQGHQVFAAARLTLPHGIDAFAAFRYEYQAYQGAYSATYSGVKAPVPTPTNPAFMLPGLTLFAIDSEQRKDHRLTTELWVSKDLPLGFSAEIAYTLLYNISNINNVIDNRSFSKNTVAASVAYAY